MRDVYDLRVPAGIEYLKTDISTLLRAFDREYPNQLQLVEPQPVPPHPLGVLSG